MRLAEADNVLTINFVQIAFNLLRTDRQDVKLQEAAVASTAHLFIDIWGGSRQEDVWEFPFVTD